MKKDKFILVRPDALREKFTEFVSKNQSTDYALKYEEKFKPPHRQSRKS
jgi:hypothetical protein